LEQRTNLAFLGDLPHHGEVGANSNLGLAAVRDCCSMEQAVVRPEGTGRTVSEKDPTLIPPPTGGISQHDPTANLWDIPPRSHGAGGISVGSRSL